MNRRGTYVAGVLVAGDVAGADHVRRHNVMTSVDLFADLLIDDRYRQDLQLFRTRVACLKFIQPVYNVSNREVYHGRPRVHPKSRRRLSRRPYYIQRSVNIPQCLYAGNQSRQTVDQSILIATNMSKRTRGRMRELMTNATNEVKRTHRQFAPTCDDCIGAGLNNRWWCCQIDTFHLRTQVHRSG